MRTWSRRLTGKEAGLVALWNFDEEDREERDVPVVAQGSITTLYSDAAGVLWIGMAEGVARYDGTTLTSLTSEDGLARGAVLAIHRSSDRAMWFGTDGHGVSRYLPPATSATPAAEDRGSGMDHVHHEGRPD